MKTAIRCMAVAAGLFAVQYAVAQAPAGATGQCKDGTYSTAASKQGACRGHQGVKEWYAAAPATTAPAAAPATAQKTAPPPPPTPPPPTPPAPTSAQAAKPSSSSSKTASMTQQPGGSPSLVWVNTSSNVYHCYGSNYYGKTKEGSYMSEADAKAKGAHPDHGHACSK